MPVESPGPSIPTVAGPWLVSQCLLKSLAWKWGSWGPKFDSFVSVNIHMVQKFLRSTLTACGVSVTHLGLGLLAGK